MTTRDRLVLMGLAALAVLAAGWFLLVTPERQHATQLGAQVSQAQTQLNTAEAELGEAHSAQTRYSAAYASIVRLGKAVPPSQEVPSLVYQLDQASNQKGVNFQSIVSGAGNSSTAAAATSTAVTPAAFTAMPFTFTFTGSYFELYHLFDQLNNYTVNTASGGVQVTGRLLTIQSAKFDMKAETASSSQQSSGTDDITATITATAYVLPASQGLTSGATASAPSAGGTQAASASGTSAPATPAAVAKVTP